jgi:type IV pilus assembly protein PilC
MPKFRWEGVSAGGAVMQGEMEAPTRSAVLARLRFQRIQPLPGKVKEKGTGLAREISVRSWSDKVKDRDLVIFTRQLSAMLKAGLPIVECLGVLAGQSSSKLLRSALRQIKEDLESGSTLSGAMRKHAKVFPETFLFTVSAGEAGGVLDHVLPRLANSIEKTAKLKAKLKGALTYPVAISAVAAVVTGVMLVFVIPAFKDMFSSIGHALPLPTQLVINLSNVAVAASGYVVAIAVIGGFALGRCYRTDRGRLVIDQLLLRAPLFGDLVRKSAVARVTHTLSTLVASGTSILDALDIAARTAGNRVVERALFATRESISEGRTLAEPLAQSKVFPPLVCHMVAVGEATGSLDAMLQEMAILYDEEVDNAVANLTSLMEPALMCFLGIVIGGLLIAMYLPIFQLGAALG